MNTKTYWSRSRVAAVILLRSSRRKLTLLDAISFTGHGGSRASDCIFTAPISRRSNMKTLYSSLAALALSAMLATPADATGVTGGRCYVEASVSAGAAFNTLSIAKEDFDLGAQGYGVAPGIGCDLLLNPFFIGILYRYDFTSIKGSAADLTSFNLTSLSTPAVRLGVNITPSTALYGIAGYTFARQKDEKFVLASSSFSGYMVGGGLEQQLNPNLSIKFEYNFNRFDHEDLTFLDNEVKIPASQGPDIHVFRIGLAYTWGGTSYSQPNFNTTYRPLK
jgi:opacity protein-like surface antigen